MSSGRTFALDNNTAVQIGVKSGALTHAHGVRFRPRWRRARYTDNLTLYPVVLKRGTSGWRVVHDTNSQAKAALTVKTYNSIEHNLMLAGVRKRNYG